MFSYVLQRSIHAMVTLVVVTMLTFLLTNLAPGGLALGGGAEGAAMSPEDIARIKANLGLEQPLHVQYLRWAGGLLQGDMGRSLIDGQSVYSLIADRLPNTILLAGIALLLSTLLGVIFGVLCAVRAYSWVDNVISAVTFLGLAIPGFWFGILLILLFTVTLGWLPSSGMVTLGKEHDVLDRIAHLIMPAIVMSLAAMPALVRFTRSGLFEVLSQDYVRTARAKGLAELVVLYRHALRNAMIPVVTLIGLQLPRLVSGAAITEAVFGWPGVGQLAVSASTRHDLTVVMGITVIVSIVVLVSTLIVDVLYAVINPRIALE